VARPTFSLTDSEARLLILELAGIEERCPINPRDHRQFVRDFIRAVHRITGKTFSPAIYRRLLGAYAPARKPSTATLALEKERLVKELDRTPASAALTEASGVGEDLARELRQLLEDLPARLAQRAPPNADSYLQAQCDFLQQRLSHSEKQLADTTLAAGKIDARRQVLEADLVHAHERIESLGASGAAMLDQLANLTRAIDDARQFAMLAIDEARGETRAWKERCLAAEAQFKAQVSLTETFRRLAYRQGADIPPALESKPT
jgi:chromosome segregation ATPase